MKLAGRDEGINWVCKNYCICVLKHIARFGKILFDAAYGLSCVQNGEGVILKFSFKIVYGLQGYAVLPLGTAVDDENVQSLSFRQGYNLFDKNIIT